MLFSIVMMYVMACATCTSTAQYSSVSTLTQPFLTGEHVDTLNMLSQELDNLTCNELQERVYNTTEPPIPLSNDKMDELREYYPNYFKNDTSEEVIDNVTQCNLQDSALIKHSTKPSAQRPHAC